MRHQGSKAGFVLGRDLFGQMMLMPDDVSLIKEECLVQFCRKHVLEKQWNNQPLLIFVGPFFFGKVGQRVLQLNKDLRLARSIHESTTWLDDYPPWNEQFAPTREATPKRKLMFQLSIFRGYVSFREGKIIKWVMFFSKNRFLKGRYVIWAGLLRQEDFNGNLLIFAFVSICFL